MVARRRRFAASALALAVGLTPGARADSPVPSPTPSLGWSRSEILSAAGVRDDLAVVRSTISHQSTRLVTVNLRSGCAIGSTDVSLVAKTAETATIGDSDGVHSAAFRRVEAILKTAEYRRQVQAYVRALVAVSGSSQFEVATSPDGRSLLVQAGDVVHWSSDGGATFGFFEAQASYDVKVGGRAGNLWGASSVCPDGCKGGIYVPRVVDFRGPTPRSKTFTAVRDIEQIEVSPDGTGVYAVRKVAEDRACVVGISTDKGTSRDIFCGGRSEPFRPKLAISRDGAYAVTTTTSGPQDAIAVLSLPTGNVVGTYVLPQGKVWLTPTVDPSGLVALQTIVRGRVTLHVVDVRAKSVLASLSADEVVPLAFRSSALIYARRLPAPGSAPDCGLTGVLSF